ncbi:MAG: HupE/UreJ family protein, partial [Chlorobi bacterium]|nr:HupE/UreJ family protein [Chlorobiota bacterium]
MFSMYLHLGIEHITDLNGYDHILFLMALSAVYLLKD